MSNLVSRKCFIFMVIALFSMLETVTIAANNSIEQTIESYLNQAESLLTSCSKVSVKDIAQQAKNAADSLQTISKEVIHSTVDKIANNEKVLSLSDTFQQHYNQATQTVEIARVLLQKRINIFECQQFMKKNPVLIAKILPMGCTTLYLLLHKVFVASNAPKNVIASLHNIAEYGQDNGFVLAIQATTNESESIIHAKHKLTEKILHNLEYNTLQDTLYSLINDNEYIATMLPTRLADKALIALIDETLYEVFIKLFTLEELSKIEIFSKTQAARQLRQPDVFNALTNVTLKPLVESPIGQRLLQNNTTPNATPIQVCMSFFTNTKK